MRSQTPIWKPGGIASLRDVHSHRLHELMCNMKWLQIPSLPLGTSCDARSDLRVRNLHRAHFPLSLQPLAGQDVWELCHNRNERALIHFRWRPSTRKTEKRKTKQSATTKCKDARHRDHHLIYLNKTLAQNLHQHQHPREDWWMASSQPRALQ